MSLEVNLAGVSLKNPVMTASGTFGSGMEYAEFVDYMESQNFSDMLDVVMFFES